MQLILIALIVLCVVLFLLVCTAPTALGKKKKRKIVGSQKKVDYIKQLRQSPDVLEQLESNLMEARVTVHF